MKMSYREAQAQTQKLLILQLLTEAVGGQENLSTIALAVTEMGFRLSTLEAETLIAQMETQQLLRTERTRVTVVATITPYGREVVTGQARVPGVADPSTLI